VLGWIFKEGEPISVAPIRTFPLIRDWSPTLLNYVKAKQVPPLRLRPPDADGKYRYAGRRRARQEFHKCIECFLCQDVCHVIRDHEEKKKRLLGPRFLSGPALEMHPLDTVDRTAFLRDPRGIGLCNITSAHRGLPRTSTSRRIIPLKRD